MLVASPPGRFFSVSSPSSSARHLRRDTVADAQGDGDADIITGIMENSVDRIKGKPSSSDVLLARQPLMSRPNMRKRRQGRPPQQLHVGKRIPRLQCSKEHSETKMHHGGPSILARHRASHDAYFDEASPVSSVFGKRIRAEHESNIVQAVGDASIGSGIGTMAAHGRESLVRGPKQG